MRGFISIIICLELLLCLSSSSLVRGQTVFTQTQATTEEPRFTAPPGEETSEIRDRIDEAQASLENGRVTSTSLLTDPAYLPAHPWPRFRTLIRQYAKTNQTILVTPEEPGEPLVVNGTIRNKRGEPIGGALIYVYQTSSKGWYSDKAPHISGMSGDEKYARLFGYLTTDQKGQYEFRTIRPAGYPRSTLPAHIHIEIKVPGAEPLTLISEIQFEDDPRLTREMRDRSLRDRFFIFPVKRQSNGQQRVKADFEM